MLSVTMPSVLATYRQLVIQIGFKILSNFCGRKNANRVKLKAP